MKNIELTEEHKSKLLEMCKILFPEYNDFEITSSFPYYNSNNLDGVKWLENPIKDAICLIKDDKDDYRSRTFHWFEFCITHLAEKLMGQYNLIRALNEEELDKHPVDYLYEEFLKLK